MRRLFVGKWDKLVADIPDSVCTLLGDAEVVTVTNDASFMLFGRGSSVTEINGRGARHVSVTFGATAQNLFSYKSNGAVVVGEGSRVGKVALKDSGNLRNQGFIGFVSSKNSGNLNIRRGVIGNSSSYSMFIEKGEPDVNLCGASIGTINTKDSSPKFIGENSSRCLPTNISSIFSRGAGTSVAVTGVRLTGKHSFSAYEVEEVEISSTTILGSVKTRFIAGALSLNDIRAEGGVSLVGTQKATTIEDSEFNDRVVIGAPERSAPRVSNGSFLTSISKCVFGKGMSLGPSAGKVKVSESKFSGERVYLETRSGSVEFTGNEDISRLRVSINPSGVEVSGNKITDGEFRSNIGGVKLVGNTFETLTCFGNNPKPELVDNAVTKGGTGQCASA